MRAWTAGGCLASAAAILVLAASSRFAPDFPLRGAVLLLGAANGAFAVSAIGAMMGLAGGGGRAGHGVSGFGTAHRATQTVSPAAPDAGSLAIGSCLALLGGPIAGMSGAWGDSRREAWGVRRCAGRRSGFAVGWGSPASRVSAGARVGFGHFRHR